MIPATAAASTAIITTHSTIHNPFLFRPSISLLPHLLHFFHHCQQPTKHPEITDADPRAGNRISNGIVAENGDCHCHRHADRHRKDPAPLRIGRAFFGEGTDLRDLHDKEKHPEQDKAGKNKVSRVLQKQVFQRRAYSRH